MPTPVVLHLAISVHTFCRKFATTSALPPQYAVAVQPLNRIYQGQLTDQPFAVILDFQTGYPGAA
jgi:hypothetical protein